MYAIETRGLTKIYRNAWGRKKGPSVDGLDLRVAQNEIFGFLGRNGAGKTTTIKSLCGLIRPTFGSASILGVDVRDRRSRRLVGYLPESPYFYEYLNPRETLDFYGQLEGLSRAERAREWDMLSEMLDLRDIAEQRVRGFSKGMRQRLGFAVALAGDPKLLVLDEPMSGLDPSGRRTIRELILRMRDAGKTVFFSSHILGDVEQICDRVAIIREGRLTVEGSVDELLTTEIKQVEVIADEMGDALIEMLQRRALSTRRSEAGRHFVFADAASANGAAGQILQAGGRLVEFQPLKESLEDYFMREQDRSAPAPTTSRSAAS